MYKCNVILTKPSHIASCGTRSYKTLANVSKIRAFSTTPFLLLSSDPQNNDPMNSNLQNNIPQNNDPNSAQNNDTQNNNPINNGSQTNNSSTNGFDNSRSNTASWSADNVMPDDGYGIDMLEEVMLYCDSKEKAEKYFEEKSRAIWSVWLSDTMDSSPGERQAHSEQRDLVFARLREQENIVFGYDVAGSSGGAGPSAGSEGGNGPDDGTDNGSGGADDGGGGE